MGDVELHIVAITTDDPVNVTAISEDNQLLITAQSEDEYKTIPMTDDIIIHKGYSPYIGDNGNWYEYDNKNKEFFDTEVAARGGIDQKTLEQIDNNTLSIAALEISKANRTEVPTKTSDLNNDNNFISESQKAVIDIDFSHFFE